MLCRPITFGSGREVNPRALNLAAYLFMAFGAFALVGYVGDLLFSDRVVFDLNVLDLWIGCWLLARDPRGYRLAVVFSGAAMIFAPVSLMVVAVIGVRPTWRFVGVDIAHGSLPVFASLILAWAGLHACQYYLLRRPHIRALFADPAENRARPA